MSQVSRLNDRLAGRRLDPVSANRVVYSSCSSLPHVADDQERRGGDGSQGVGDLPREAMRTKKQTYSSVKVGIEVARGIRKFQHGYAKVLAARRVPSQANCQPWWSASRESRCCRNPPELGCSRPARHIFDPITPPPILSQKFKSTAVSSSRLR